MSIENVRTRDEVVDFFEGFTQQPDEGDEHARRPPVKTYMLETVPDGQQQPDLDAIFRRQNHLLVPIDPTLSKIVDGNLGRTVGILEKLMPRHPVIYTPERANLMDVWVRKLVDSDPGLDHLWLSGRAFEQLLETVMRITPGHRFGRLVFQYLNAFETENEADSSGAFDSEDDPSDPSGLEAASTEGNDDDGYVPERRATKFAVVDRLDILRVKLTRMREIYSPLHAIQQLRFPARGRGGHDFYAQGKATNRSQSFTDHRQHVTFVLRIYKRATEATETTAWQQVEPTAISEISGGGQMLGAPVVLKFSETLTESVFRRFIQATFRRKNNRFRLWGNPIWLGPSKVHVYALDRHLWQPLFLEITAAKIVAIIPRGTCGNTIHRLVTNVQHHLDPAVAVTVGDRDYGSLLAVSSDIRSVYDDA
jgi:hypothetical protein